MTLNVKTKDGYNKQWLASLPLFAGLSDEQQETLFSTSYKKSLTKGSILFHQGDKPDGFYFVYRGQVQLSMTNSEGIEKIAEIICENGSFGEAVMFLERAYPVTATAIRDSELVHISSETTLKLLEQDSTFVRQLLANMSIRIHTLMSDIRSNALLSGRQKVVAYILELIPADSSNSVRVELPISKQALASRLGLKPETLSRVFRALIDDKLISVNKRNLTIGDVIKLSEVIN